ncbi:MAG: hypothetical protein LBD13_04730 [Spirochaetaceae bacterium]|jgi:hypothetical protein|nr:hypothetical protein [Spirochaetaceae bacterium]
MTTHESIKYSSSGYGINLPLEVPKGEKVTLPVSSSSYVYANFKHVTGTPAPEGERGFTISRLKIVDVLIEQMNRLKTQEEAGAPRSAEETKKSMEQLHAELRHMKERAGRPYNPPLIEPSGALFNLIS